MLTIVVSLVTVYTVHNSQRVAVRDPYRSANTEEDDLEMQRALDAINEMNAHTPPPPALSRESCHIKENSEIDGRVVKWGADHFTETPADCCAACTNHPDCNVWVWCASLQGCGSGRQHKECWLKKNTVKNIIDSEGYAHPGIPWTSGALYPPEERLRVQEAERLRLEALRDNADLPMVYLDVAVKGKHIGRIKIVLFKNEAPRAAENFRALCTGEKGIVPQGHEGAGKPYHFKGSTFYRIIDRFIDQTGANTESIYGGAFKDDPGGLALKHDRKGVLSMANAGPDTNTSHFSILMAPAPHLDGHYTVFGEVVEGLEVAEKVNALARGKPNNTAGPEEEAVITDAGQLR
ncbi:hypothetical protein HYH02_013635 [Chlamydomonas schloesseri]|uniref:PPIase cyclophilin-type domain-containing protein n=1 Tax=Chlamydomonas schloesseri TaxID=2026947 RepID=A0A835SSK4_9CHLO|nr:hypothetical protein HYH02_013635 [Chlamydomonas schloesseri]|eukprot:KAG2430637.1 hypothetical protein HYH02_013635 [Chlamydomonas schloesseri]